jgi:hypothetical protein
MSDAETDRLSKRDREPRDPRQVSMPVATVGALLTSVLSSFGSGAFVANRAESAQREGQIRVELKLEQVAGELRRVADDNRVALTELRSADRAIDERVRALELQDARRGGATPGGPR